MRTGLAYKVQYILFNSHPNHSLTYLTFSNCPYLFTLLDSATAQPSLQSSFLTELPSAHSLRSQRFLASLSAPRIPSTPHTMGLARKGYNPPAIKGNPSRPPNFGRVFSFLLPDLFLFLVCCICCFSFLEFI